MFAKMAYLLMPFGSFI